MRRSSVVPQTMARETAQKTNWKNSNAAGLMPAMSSSGNCCAASDGTELTSRKNPLSPAIFPAPPKARAKPTAQYASAQIEKLVRILTTPRPAFFAREKPTSRNRNPACMNMTSTPATITQVVFTAEIVSSRVGPSAASAAVGATKSNPSGTPAARAIRLMALSLLLRESAATVRAHPRPVFIPVSKIRGRRFAGRSSAYAVGAGSSTGSASGGSAPPRSVPAISSSPTLSLGMKPDFMPK